MKVSPRTIGTNHNPKPLILENATELVIQVIIEKITKTKSFSTRISLVAMVYCFADATNAADLQG